MTSEHRTRLENTELAKQSIEFYHRTPASSCRSCDLCRESQWQWSSVSTAPLSRDPNVTQLFLSKLWWQMWVRRVRIDFSSNNQYVIMPQSSLWWGRENSLFSFFKDGLATGGEHGLDFLCWKSMTSLETQASQSPKIWAFQRKAGRHWGRDSAFLGCWPLHSADSSPPFSWQPPLSSCPENLMQS